MGDSIIAIDNLTKSYGEIKAVDGISFRVEKGSLFAFLGINGAGKSTTINIICSITDKDGGRVVVDGLDLEKHREEIKRKIGIVFQKSVLDESLTVYDNLVSRASLYGIYGDKFKEKLSVDAFLKVYRKIGGQYEWNSGKLIADGSGVGCPLPYLETEIYPGFPTDLQSPLMAVLATIPGKSHIRENIFEDRFKLAGELNRMGARVTVSGRDAWIQGTDSLTGCRVEAEELRGGAALILAALAAEGETVISGCSYIRRGYEHICRDLAAVGGRIEEKTGKVLYENIQIQEKNNIN